MQAGGFLFTDSSQNGAVADLLSLTGSSCFKGIDRVKPAGIVVFSETDRLFPEGSLVFGGKVLSCAHSGVCIVLDITGFIDRVHEAPCPDAFSFFIIVVDVPCIPASDDQFLPERDSPVSGVFRESSHPDLIHGCLTGGKIHHNAEQQVDQYDKKNDCADIDMDQLPQAQPSLSTLFHKPTLSS